MRLAGKFLSKALLGSILIISIAAAGQPGWGRGPEGAPCLKDLSEEQKTQLDELRDGFHEEVITIRENPDLTPEEKREMIHERWLSHREEVKGILTEEQLEAWNNCDRPAKFRRGGFGEGRKFGKTLPFGRGFGPGHRMGMMADPDPFILEQRREFDQLLTAEEKETIESVRGELKAIREELSPGPEAREAFFDAVAPLRDIADNHQDDLEAIRDECREHLGKPLPPEGRGFGPHKGIGFLLLDPEKAGERNTALPGRLTLMPNPVSDNLNIAFEAETTGQAVVTVLNRSGRILLEKSFDVDSPGSQSLNLDVSELEGHEVYIVRVRLNDYSLSGRFIRK
ncbi:MAG: hypothetical protein Kow00127_20040 [Bacteroidales bacterium]